jgi:hypothetical protein
MYGSGASHILQFGFGRVVSRMRDCSSTDVEMSTLVGTSNSQFFYLCSESCALHPDTEIAALFQNINEVSPLPLTGALNARREDIAQ